MLGAYSYHKMGLFTIQNRQIWDENRQIWDGEMTNMGRKNRQIWDGKFK